MRRLLLLLLLLLSPPAPGQEAPAPAVTSTGTAPAGLQEDPRVADLQRQLADANAKALEAQQAPPVSGVAAVLAARPWLAVAIPGLAALLSLVALVWSLVNRSRNKAEIAAQQGAWKELNDRIDRLQAQAVPGQAASAPSSRTRAPEAPRGILAPKPQRPASPTVARGPVPGQSPASRQPEKPSDSPRRPVPSAPAEDTGTMRPSAVPVEPPTPAPASHPEPVAEPQAPTPVTETPVLWQKTRDLAADYNRARALGLDAEDAFQAAYRCAGLSCANLNDLRKDPAATLRFERSGRGLFLAVEAAPGARETLIVPAFGKDFAAARASFEGVFLYDDSRAEGLIRPAQAVFTNELWTLREPGEIGLG